MKKFFLIISLLILTCSITSCNSSNQYEDISLTNEFAPKTSYQTLFHADVGTGFVHSKNGCLWYLDYETETDIPFCSNPACSHNRAGCDAEFSGLTYIYKGTLIDIPNHFTHDENRDWVDITEFIMSDLNGQNRKTISQLNYFITDMLAYEDRLYLCCLNYYYIEGEEKYSQPSHGKAYLAEVSLETGEVTYFSECLSDGWNNGLSLGGIYDGELYFQYSYSDEFDGEYTWPSELTWHSNYRKMDLKTYEITEITEEEFFYIIVTDVDGIENNARLYCTENEIIFETTKKKCQVYHSVPANLGAFALVKKGNDIYFSVSFNKNGILKYNTEEEKLYEAVKNWRTKDFELYSVSDSGKYIFGTYDHIYRDGNFFIVGKDELEFKEVDQNRLNEICENYNKGLEKTRLENSQKLQEYLNE